MFGDLRKHALSVTVLLGTVDALIVTESKMVSAALLLSDDLAAECGIQLIEMQQLARTYYVNVTKVPRPVMGSSAGVDFMGAFYNPYTMSGALVYYGCQRAEFELGPGTPYVRLELLPQDSRPAKIMRLNKPLQIGMLMQAE